MSESRNAAKAEQRSLNLLGAVSLAVADLMTEATEASSGHGSAGPAALVALHEFLDGASIDDLRRVVGLTSSGAVRLVDRLAADGYVERRAGASGRSVAVTLTPSGHGAARAVLRARAKALEGAVAGLTVSERAALTRLHERLLSAMAGDRLAARARGEPPSGGWLCRLCDLGACGRARGTCPSAEAASRTIGPERFGRLT